MDSKNLWNKVKSKKKEEEKEPYWNSLYKVGVGVYLPSAFYM